MSKGYRLRTEFDADWFKNRIKLLAESISYDIEVYVGSAPAINKSKKSSSSSGQSSHQKNKQKFDINKNKYGRDPVQIDQHMRKIFHDRLRRAMIAEYDRGVRGRFKRACEAVGEALVDIIRQNIDSGNLGSPRPLTDKYDKWKNRNYPGEPMLRASGELYNSIKSRVKKR
jgi:hypothetical protein